MKYWGLIFTFFCCTAVSAQQRPYYTQYIMNNYIINPAVAGIENYWDVKASHRMQWVGLQDAPVTTYLTMHGPLKQEPLRSEKMPPAFMRRERTREGRLTGAIMLHPNHIMELALQ